MKTRRILLVAPLATLAVLGVAGTAAMGGGSAPEPAAPAAHVATVAQDIGPIEVHRSVTCGCCGGHVEHLEEAGFEVEERLYEDSHATAEMKRAAGVPEEMWSCHTTVIGNYTVEGHVPADVIVQLLDEAPDVDGIALPGMPSGTPGMDGEKDSTWSFESFGDAQPSGTFTVR